MNRQKQQKQQKQAEQKQMEKPQKANHGKTQPLDKALELIQKGKEYKQKKEKAV